jgi:hypothetical protein
VVEGRVNVERSHSSLSVVGRVHQTGVGDAHLNVRVGHRVLHLRAERQNDITVLEVARAGQVAAHGAASTLALRLSGAVGHRDEAQTDRVLVLAALEQRGVRQQLALHLRVDRLLGERKVERKVQHGLPGGDNRDQQQQKLHVFSGGKHK